MLIKTLLNNIEKYPSFVYTKVYLGIRDKAECLIIEISPRKGSKGKCPECHKSCSTYDSSQKPRYFSYVLICGLPVFFSYRSEERRVGKEFRSRWSRYH